MIKFSYFSDPFSSLLSHDICLSHTDTGGTRSAGSSSHPPPLPSLPFPSASTSTSTSPARAFPPLPPPPPPQPEELPRPPLRGPCPVAALLPSPGWVGVGGGGTNRRSTRTRREGRGIPLPFGGISACFGFLFFFLQESSANHSPLPVLSRTDLFCFTFLLELDACYYMSLVILRLNSIYSSCLRCFKPHARHIDWLIDARIAPLIFVRLYFWTFMDDRRLTKHARTMEL